MTHTGLASWTLWSTRKKRGDHLAIDVYTKPTDRNGLLLFTSCHPPSIKNSIPKSQFHRVDRIVSDENLKQTRLIEMEHKFIDRGYPKGILSEAKRNMSSSKTRDISKRIPFVTTFHPFSGLVQSTIRRHWNILSKSYPNIAEFRLPFLSCFKRARNLKDRLVKADIGPSTLLPKQVFLHTQKRGTFPCLNCLQCSNVQKGPSVFHPQTGKAIPIKGFYTCESTFVVYIIKCPCGLAYIGETTQAVRDRVAQHKSTIRCNKAHLPLPFHFSEKNHNIAQLRFQVLEQVDIPRRGQNRTKMLQKREAYWIYTLQTLEPRGLNRDYDVSAFLRPVLLDLPYKWHPCGPTLLVASSYGQYSRPVGPAVIFERPCGSPLTKVEAVSPLSKFEAGSPLTKFEAGSPLTKFEAGSPLTKFEVGSPLTKFEAGSPLTKFEAGSPLTKFEAGSPLTKFEVGSPLTKFEVGSPLTKCDAGSPLTKFEAGSPLTKFEAGSPLTKFEAGSPLTKFEAGSPQKTSFHGGA
ncbi:unnamed protein product [Ranitomeya imitator]|uniref:GIY-YIG domain-containing protein n=1 Tax=Ranitomeya imitator TaxID=111125 RepID=A0ABN9LTG7_9NEOB|nr:unnamed protein product [Ranitomeya imitator]